MNVVVGNNQMKPERLNDRILGYGALMFLCIFIGGVLGFLSQTGLWDLYKSETAETHLERRHYADEAMRPITHEEYTFRTHLGWWIGCAAGATFGIWQIIRRD